MFYSGQICALYPIAFLVINKSMAIDFQIIFFYSQATLYTAIEAL